MAKKRQKQGLPLWGYGLIVLVLLTIARGVYVNWPRSTEWPIQNTFTLEESNVVIDEAEIIFLAMQHYQFDRDEEASEMIDLLAQNNPEKEIVVLFEGMDASREIDYDNPEDNYDIDFMQACCAFFNYTAAETSANLYGWEDSLLWEQARDGLNRQIQIVDEVISKCGVMEPAPVWGSGATGTDPICLEWNANLQEIFQLQTERNEAMVNAIETFTKRYDTVIIVAGPGHWFDSPEANVVRENVREYDYVVYSAYED